ncbi:MAG TPA: HDOD domain-containing protein [Gammaproteobacteria bacterium]|nr:HDOD domain-containing protein [Gammaproteobacteria bacterium]
MNTHKVFRAVLDYLAIETRTTASPPAGCAEAVLLKDDQGFVAAIFPNRHQLDLSALKNALHRNDLRFLSTAELDTLSNYFRQQPPNPASQGFRFVFDEALAEQDHIGIRIDGEEQPLQLPALNSASLSRHALFGSQISSPMARRPASQQGNNDMPKLDIREQLKNIRSLPVMPDMTLRIMELRNNPDADIDQLVGLVSQDGSLAAQVLRYANSALFGQRGRVKTLKDAIFRVLGYENVLHMALGASMARAFKLPESGPLGADSYWHGATYCASLAQRLSRELDKSLGIKPGMAYLCGLLHNIGYLVLGTLFPSEYFWFNKVLGAKKDTPVLEIEQRLLGITHAELGKQLMDFWHMPEEISAVVAHHHQPEQAQAHAAHVALIALADQILKGHGMSDADTDEVSTALCQQLGLEDSQVYEAMDEVLQSGEELEVVVRSMAG